MKFNSKVFDYLTLYFIEPLTKIICNYADFYSLKLNHSFTTTYPSLVKNGKIFIAKNKRILEYDFYGSIFNKAILNLNDKYLRNYKIEKGMLSSYKDMFLGIDKIYEITDQWIIYLSLNSFVISVNRSKKIIKNTGLYLEINNMDILGIGKESTLIITNSNRFFNEFKYKCFNLIKNDYSDEYEFPLNKYIDMNRYKSILSFNDTRFTYLKNGKTYGIIIKATTIKVIIEDIKVIIKEIKAATYEPVIEFNLPHGDDKYTYSWNNVKWIKHIWNRIFFIGKKHKYIIKYFIPYKISTSVIFELNLATRIISIHECENNFDDSYIDHIYHFVIYTKNSVYELGFEL